MVFIGELLREDMDAWTLCMQITFTYIDIQLLSHLIISLCLFQAAWPIKAQYNIKEQTHTPSSTVIKYRPTLNYGVLKSFWNYSVLQSKRIVHCRKGKGAQHR